MLKCSHLRILGLFDVYFEKYSLILEHLSSLNFGGLFRGLPLESRDTTYFHTSVKCAVLLKSEISPAHFKDSATERASLCYEVIALLPDAPFS